MDEQAMEALADRLAVQDVLTRYVWALDTKTFDDLDQVFTADAFIDYTSSGGIKGQYPEVKEWLANVLPHFPTYQHYVTNTDITIDGDRATSRCALYNPMGHQKKEGAISFFLVGAEYHDKLVRTDSGWRIAERIEKTMWTDGDLPAAPPI
jgi:hypothetical protein